MTNIERISVDFGDDADDERWEVVREWVRTSYTLVAPRSLAELVLEEDGIDPDA